jgi:L-cysteine/cystine lyase
VRVKSPSYFSQESYELSGAFVARSTSARFDAGWIGVPNLVGLVTALGTHPEWRYERAAEMAAHCRELLEPHVEIVTPPGHSTLVSFRPNGDPTELVQSLQDDGVIVRELPGRNLVRASCGWWTNEGDLQRLAAGLSI